MYAAENGDPTTVQALLTNGADVNARDSQGWTALVYAAENGDITTVQTLLAHKAHVNAKSEGTGWTALMSAAARGRLSVVQALLASGAEANSRDKDDQTALILAVQQGDTAVVQALLEGGADVNVKNKEGKTALAIAEAQGFSKIAQLLKQAEKPAPTADKPPLVPLLPSPPSRTSRAAQPTKLRVPTAPAVEAEPVQFGRYHALVIGNNAYTDMSPLKTAVSDATAIAELLRTTYGFTVTLLTNATREDIIMALDQLRATLTEQDNLLIYYAGHGILDTREERGYWLPVNARQDSRIQWIPNTTVTDALKAMEAKHILIVADSCYSGMLMRGIDVVRPPSGGAERDAYLARIVQKRSRTVLTSGGEEPVADSGGGGEHSVFAKAFLTALQDNRDVLDSQQLFHLVRSQVMQNAQQIPAYTNLPYAGHEGGDFLFVRQELSDQVAK
jgi:hypothetical protein